MKYSGDTLKNSIYSFRTHLKYIFYAVAVSVIAISLLFFALSASKPGMGFVLSLENEAWIVQSVDPAGAASQAGITPGDRPESINGQPAPVFLDRYSEQGVVMGFLIHELTVVDNLGQVKTVDFAYSSPNFQSVTEVAVWFLVSLISWLTGLFVYHKKPHHPPALLLCLGTLVFGLALSATLAGERLVMLATHIAVVSTVLAPVLLLHFFIVLPDNRINLRNSPLQFLIYLPAVITIALYPLIGFADGQPLQDFRTFRLAVVGLALLAVIGVAFFNYFSAVYMKTRQQMKIIFVGCLAAIIPFVFLSVFPAILGSANVMPASFSMLFVSFIPLSMGYAIVTKKFMGIDVIIRKSVISGSILFLMAAFLSVAIVLILALSSPTGIVEIIYIALVLSATATLLFGPLSRLSENIIDRLFYKDRYDHRVIIKDLSDSLTRLNDFDSASSIIVTTLENTLGLRGACLFIETEDGKLWTGASGGIFADVGKEQRVLQLISQKRDSSIEFPNSASDVDAEIKYLVPLSAGGKEIGFLVISTKTSGEQFLPADQLLIQDLAMIAAVSLKSLLVITSDITERKKAEEGLRLSEEKFRLMTEKTSDIVWTLDLNLRTTYVSPSTERVLGFSPEERLLQSLEEQVTPECLPKIYKLLEEELNRDLSENADPNRSVIVEIEYFRKDGSTVWMENKVSALRDDKGKITGFHGVSRDITERKKAQEELDRKTAEYETVFNSSQSAMFLIEVVADNTFCYIRNNKAHQAATGISLEELRGKTPPELVGEQLGHQIAQKYQTCVQLAKTISYEETLDLPGGKKTWYTNLTPVINQHGEVTHIVGSSEDITERKKAEDALEKAAKDWRATFDSITDMIAIIDADRKILRVNHAFADAFNDKPYAFLGKYCHEVVHDMKKPHPLCTFESAVKTQKACCHELYEPKLGKHLECTMSPLRDEENGCLGVVHIFKDITERKNMEAEQEVLRNKAEMSSRLSTVGEMAAGIAHEINNPLTSVLGFSELLLQEDLPPEVKDSFKYIVDGSNRVKEIVRRLLTFARQSKPCKTNLDIHELINNTLELRGYVLKTANIDVIKQYSSDLPWVTVDSAQLQQVFLNIIVNAEYAMKKAHDQGILTIITRKEEDDNITISFKDDGPGIPEDAVSKVFDPFFTTKDPGEGTGLGLSLSRSIILEHGGSIEVESEIGRGATFIIRLPASPELIEMEAIDQKQVDLDKEKRKAHILVIDDEDPIRTFISKVLTPQGYRVIEAANSGQALENLERHKFDIILLDIRMPGISGRQLYEQISNKWPQMEKQVIFITGDVSDISTREFIKTKCLTLITKPFDKATLLTKINEVLSKK